MSLAAVTPELRELEEARRLVESLPESQAFMRRLGNSASICPFRDNGFVYVQLSRRETFDQALCDQPADTCYQVGHGVAVKVPVRKIPASMLGAG